MPNWSNQLFTENWNSPLLAVAKTMRSHCVLCDGLCIVMGVALNNLDMNVSYSMCVRWNAEIVGKQKRMCLVCLLVLAHGSVCAVRWILWITFRELHSFALEWSRWSISLLLVICPVLDGWLTKWLAGFMILSRHSVRKTEWDPVKMSRINFVFVVIRWCRRLPSNSIQDSFILREQLDRTKITNEHEQQQQLQL